jgi:hypothetical protein
MKFALIGLLAFTIGNFEISVFNKAIVDAINAVTHKRVSLIDGALKLDEKISELDKKDKWVLAPHLNFSAKNVFWDEKATTPTKVTANVVLSADSKTSSINLKGNLSLKTNYMSLFRESAKLARENEATRILSQAKNREDVLKALAAIDIGEEDFLKLLRSHVQKELDKEEKLRTYRLEIVPTADLDLSDGIFLEKLVIDLSANDVAKFELQLKSGKTLLDTAETYVKNPLVELITHLNSSDKNEQSKASKEISDTIELLIPLLDGYLSGTVKP